jgi:hypothetical protein
MNNGTRIWWLYDLLESARTTSRKAEGADSWIPARPLGWTQISYRLKAALMVFTGKADAVVWPGVNDC